MTERNGSLSIPRETVEKIRVEVAAWMDREFGSLPLLLQSGKIILQLEINCGIGGTIGDIECQKIIKKKWR